MTTKNPAIFTVIQVVFWIVFIGLCIKTGALLISFLVSLFINPEAANELYQGLNLSGLYDYNKLFYFQVASLIIFSMALKAWIAYLVVRIFMILDLSKPFHERLTGLFLKISYYSFVLGIFTILLNGTGKWLLKRGIDFPVSGGSGEILFFAGVIYLLALVFKKGAELQSENDLTV
jgi:hypothetical protein